jgi:hypothetical protein
MEIILSKSKTQQTIPLPNRIPDLIIKTCVFEETEIEKIEIVYSSLHHPISNLNGIQIVREKCEASKPIRVFPKHQHATFTHVTFRIPEEAIKSGSVRLSFEFDVTTRAVE